jgi:hypothetical protein
MKIWHKIIFSDVGIPFKGEPWLHFCPDNSKLEQTGKKIKLKGNIF